LPLPALDLPVSRTGLLLYHPPQFKLTTATGAFRVQEYEAPHATALNRSETIAIAGAAGFVTLNTPGIATDQVSKIGEKDDAKAAQAANQAALDKFREKSKAGKVAGILPIRVAFPEIGPSLFLVSELTAENQVPNADVNYQHDKKGGAK
jgi:hypothetical protein